jgi:transposase
MVADKGYDADHFVARITATGAQAVIPPRSNRLHRESSIGISTALAI